MKKKDEVTSFRRNNHSQSILGQGSNNQHKREIIAVKLFQVKGPIINTKEEAMKALGIDKRLIGELDYGVTIQVGAS